MLSPGKYFERWIEGMKILFGKGFEMKREGRFEMNGIMCGLSIMIHRVH